MPWFMRPVDHYVVLVPDYLSDTVERCRREGWAEIPDPRDPVAPSQPQTVIDTVIDTDPAATAARREQAQAAHVKATKARNTSARQWIERKG